jgi:hypothetical protein
VAAEAATAEMAVVETAMEVAAATKVAASCLLGRTILLC